MQRWPKWSIVGAMCVLSGCHACDDYSVSFTLVDSQVVQVTQGTGTPTQHGCDVACSNLWTHPGDPFPDAGSSFAPPVESCSLSGTALTFVFHRCVS
jgi:hypothetical protein